MTGEFPAQKASNAENVSAWWRHHAKQYLWPRGIETKAWISNNIWQTRSVVGLHMNKLHWLCGNSTYFQQGQSYMYKGMQSNYLNPLRAKFPEGTKKLFTFYVIPPHWYDPGGCNPSSKVRPLQWRHNERDDVSNHQPYDCLLKRLFRRRSKKTPKLRTTGLCAGNSPETGEFPAQMASCAEKFTIWWRHHEKLTYPTYPISWLLMTWRRKGPAHQQPWYSLS